MSNSLVALCLACSSSPSPKAHQSSPFTTACCSRPICERCLTKNPRLRGYNPCLACLAGVAVVGQSRMLGGKLNVRATVPGPSGRSQKEEDSMFVVGDSDEDDEPKADADNQDPPPPPYVGSSEVVTSFPVDNGAVACEDVRESEIETPSKYYIQPSDTLRGIALRFDVDGRTICQLNALPFSTLSTTPHLLHTRRWLTLPPVGRPLPPPDPKIVEAHNRERAEKRFQFVTKEVDWRVAKAYVALAEADDEVIEETKEDHKVTNNDLSGKRVLEAKAVDKYMDDEQWEAGQSGGPRLQGFPPFTRK